MWLQVHDDIIKAIRNTGSKNIIVLDEHGYGQGSGYYGGKTSYDSAIIRMGPELNKKYKDLVYSLHVYGAWRDGYSRFNNYFKDAKDSGLCIILGEYGASTDNTGEYNAIKNMLNSALPNKIGRIYWAWDDAGLPLTKDGCGWKIDTKNGENPNNLNWPGQMVWLDNRGLLTAPVPEYTISGPLLVNGDFENGMPVGWANWVGCSVVNGVSHNGSKALVVAAGAAGGGGCAMELKAGTKYKFTAWGRNNPSSTSGSDVGIKFRIDPNDSNEYHYNVSFTSDIWQQKSITFSTPAGGAYGATLFVWKNNTSAFYLDDMELEEVE